MAVRALAYARFSAEEQADPGAGIDEQLDTVCAAIAERGWELAAEVTDLEVSAAEPPSRRAGLGPALEALAAGAADALVVATLDRVTRSPLAWAEIVERSRRHGWTLLVAAEGLDLRTDNDEMFGGVARCGRRFITTRTKEGIKAAKARGTRLGRPVEHSRTVRSFVESARAKGATLRQIAGELTALGVATPRGGRWHPNTVRSILNSSRLDAEAAETRDAFIGPALRGAREQLELHALGAFKALIEHLCEIAKDLREILAAIAMGNHPAAGTAFLCRDQMVGTAVRMNRLGYEADDLMIQRERLMNRLGYEADDLMIQRERLTSESVALNQQVLYPTGTPFISYGGGKSLPSADSLQTERERLTGEAIRVLTTEAPQALGFLEDCCSSLGSVIVDASVAEKQAINEAIGAAEWACMTAKMAGEAEQRTTEARNRAIEALEAAERAGAATGLADDVEKRSDEALATAGWVVEARRRAAEARKRLIKTFNQDAVEIVGRAESAETVERTTLDYWRST